MIMKKTLFVFLHFWARVFGRLARVFLSAAKANAPSGIQQQAVACSTAYDMMIAPDEPYYADQYWRILLPYLKLLPSDSNIIDLGCGQGRFTIRLGEFFPLGKLVGCDISADAITRAKIYAAENSVNNIDFRVLEIAGCLKNIGEDFAHVIFLTEVIFCYPDWQTVLPEIIKILKPGGILVMSFRSQYFNALSLVRNRLWGELQTLMKMRNGQLLGSLTVFTWQTSYEIRNLLVESFGLELLDLRGIGVCSGIPADPHDYICRPSELNQNEQKLLMNLEIELGKSVPDGARYILAVARKPIV